MAGTIRKSITPILAAIVSAATLNLSAAETPADSLRAHTLKPVEVLGIKQSADGVAATQVITRISGSESRRLGIDAAKGISTVAPNFYMPDYGSRMTSSIYVRGLGARIDQPVVGLNVDNIPYMNKDNFDFDILDIENIEVLRGAQALLNGRNTMAGQINIRTLSPLTTKGLRATAEYGTANSTRVGAAYYRPFNEKLGMSLAGQFAHTDGFFRNQFNNERLDKENSGSLRWKTAWRPKPGFSLSNAAVFNRNVQGGYPYSNIETEVIAFNDPCNYRRTSFADALTVAWAGKRVLVTSVTSVQYLDDCMTLDQDFTTDDYFTLTQDRQEWALTEDLFVRGSRGAYSWLGGVFGFYKSTDMDAPVTFFNTGIERLIESNRNHINPEYPIRWDERNFTLGSNFDLDNGGVAFYHQSTYHLDKWRFEAGLRLDIEKSDIAYHSFCNTGFSTYHVQPDGSQTLYSNTPLNINDRGSLCQTFIELLPKVAVSYQGAGFTPYISFSKAYKAGGYNTQMFSDVLQQRLMAEMGLTPLYSLEEIVAYKPEKSFNYEAGIRLTPCSTLKLDATAFFIDVHNQQLTVFPPGTVTGRVMTNAGRTFSAGAELTASWDATADLRFNAAYGFTDARFHNYNDGRADYAGKRVPYAPANTLFVDANYTATPLIFKNITPSVNVNFSGVGDIYWNEANTVRQPFYGLLGASLGFSASHWSLRLWARNLTATRYSNFYFLSIGHQFTQQGRPRTFGATLRLRF